jgi:hypothetical protein
VKPGDRVFVDGRGAGHVVTFVRDPGSFRPRIRPRTWVLVELDTGRRIRVRGDEVKVQAA